VIDVPDRKSPWKEDLTEKESLLLNALTKEPSTLTTILQKLGVEGTFLLREALVEEYTKLEGKGLVVRLWPRGDRPSMWLLTTKAGRVT